MKKIKLFLLNKLQKAFKDVTFYNLFYGDTDNYKLYHKSPKARFNMFKTFFRYILKQLKFDEFDYEIVKQFFNEEIYIFYKTNNTKLKNYLYIIETSVNDGGILKYEILHEHNFAKSRFENVILEHNKILYNKSMTKRKIEPWNHININTLQKIHNNVYSNGTLTIKLKQIETSQL